VLLDKITIRSTGYRFLEPEKRRKKMSTLLSGIVAVLRGAGVVVW